MTDHRPFDETPRRRCTSVKPIPKTLHLQAPGARLPVAALELAAVTGPKPDQASRKTSGG
jgi:hypothetical protein